MSKRATWATTAAALLLLGGGAFAIEPEDVTKQPGYVDFGGLEVCIDFETPMLGDLLHLVATSTRHSDPDLSRAIAKLKQIRVSTFHVERDKIDELKAKTEDLSRRLERQGWQTMVRVKQPKGDKETCVYTKWVDDKMRGLLVMDIDPLEEVSLVNIVGEIDPEQICRMSSKLNITSLEMVGGEIRASLRHGDHAREKEKKR